jgi:acetyl esterase/lipase
VILYLPPGPILQDQDYSQDIPAALSADSQSIVVQVNYRLDDKNKYPTPVHDVLAGYDWVLEHLVHCSYSESRGGDNGRLNLGVCGELVGGSLASMLALTECRLGGPRIGAAAVNNPILDWLFMDSLDQDVDLRADDVWPSAYNLTTPAPTEKPSSKRRRISSWSRYFKNHQFPGLRLLQSRGHFFQKPEDLFDRFASPLLFFRSPDAELASPLEEQPDPKIRAVDVAQKLDKESTHETSQNILASDLNDKDMFEFAEYSRNPTDLSYFDFDELTNLPQDDIVPTQARTIQLLRRRKYHRVHPAAGSGLSLPDFLVSVGTEVVLVDQIEEFVKLMRRSIVREYVKNARNERYSPLSNESGEDEKLPEAAVDEATMISERQVKLTLNDRVGLWTGNHRSEDWRRQIQDVGAWFRSTLAS